ncbi:MAG: hypothetical protein ABL934_09655 [Lysobacteraceae bacterium]
MCPVIESGATDFLNECLAEANSPDFDGFDKQSVAVLDWRSHVPGEVRRAWADLDIQARCAVIFVCKAFARSERWD